MNDKGIYNITIKILLTIALSAILLPAFLFLTAPLINNNIAKKTADSLADVPLPNQTEYIESTYVAGKLVGNGNGMQYFGAILLHSDLSLDELKARYADYAGNDRELTVDQQTSSEITVLEHTRLEFKTDIDDGKYFIVYSWGSNDTLFHEFDLRGH